MENYDFYLLGSLESSLGHSAEEILHGRFPDEEQAFDLTKILPYIAIERMRRLGRPIPENLRIEFDRFLGEGRVMDALLDGKVCVDYLISTQGGDLSYWAKTGTVFSLIQSNDGIVRTYALEQAKSLGAYNWGLGDERYACRDSQFMWHLPQDRSEGRLAPDLIADLTDRARSYMADVFESNPKGIPWAQIVRQMGVSDELNLSAEDLQKAGFIHKVFQYREDVRAHIAEGTPWKFTQADNDAFFGPQVWYELCG